jgi:large subunit ribosomal protein L23
MYNIKPLISEKSVSLVANNVYTILVPREFTKKKIEAVIKEVYKITPLDIRTSTKKSLSKKKAKAVVKDRGFKKAIIKLKKGDMIPGFETFIEEKNKEVKSVVKKTVKSKSEKVVKQKLEVKK